MRVTSQVSGFSTQDTPEQNIHLLVNDRKSLSENELFNGSFINK